MTYNPNGALLRLCLSLLILLGLIAYGISIINIDVSMDLLARRLPPSAEYWFGTDSLDQAVVRSVFVSPKIGRAHV